MEKIKEGIKVGTKLFSYWKEGREYVTLGGKELDINSLFKAIDEGVFDEEIKYYLKFLSKD